MLTEEKQTELYISIETKNNIDRYCAYATFRVDSNDLLIYLEDDMEPGQDQLLPIFTSFIDEILEEHNDGICLDMVDLKEVLKKGNVTLLASVKGKNIDKWCRIYCTDQKNIILASET